MTKSVHSPRYKSFMKSLVAARGAAGLSQRQLAERLGRSPSFVAKYEIGERRLDVVEFLEIAEKLDIDPREIIDGLVSRRTTR